MNANKVIGYVCVSAAAVLACLCISATGGAVERLVGKAVWYVPYVALVVGVRRLVRARG